MRLHYLSAAGSTAAIFCQLLFMQQVCLLT